MSTLGVIFDMDGVLVDSYRTHFLSWLNTAHARGLVMQEEDFRKTFGRTSREIIQQLWPGRFDDEQIRQFDLDKEAAYRHILAQNFPEMDGASDLLAALHEAGFKLAIGSSGPPPNVDLARRLLRRGDLFDATVTGAEVSAGKPDPQVFLLAADKLGLKPQSCAVVEDAPVGVEAARRAGMAAIGITGTAPRDVLSRRAHLVVDSLRQLTPQIVRNVIQQAQQA